MQGVQNWVAEFNKSNDSCTSFSEGKSGEPVLPRYRKASLAKVS